jgi:hypothetical protein
MPYRSTIPARSVAAETADSRWRSAAIVSREAAVGCGSIGSSSVFTGPPVRSFGQPV